MCLIMDISVLINQINQFMINQVQINFKSASQMFLEFPNVIFLRFNVSAAAIEVEFEIMNFCLKIFLNA